ncbi:MAG: DegT/DnrJ/EryC1/StrS family aminotransferase [Xanthomonadales bacterium]|nr:DegT/DnrJ/EryC1/StrS family aminotransferase [Xanthomonadales bacterium]
MNDAIPLALPEFDESERQALREVLESRRWSVGPQIEAFESEIAAHARCRGAVGVNSGTTALTLAMQALGIGRGDEVIVPAFTFVGSVNAVLAAGASPVLVDVSADTLQIDPGAVDAAIGPRTRAVMAVHLYGRAAPIDALLDLTRARGVKLIEDACEALGATCAGQPVGALGDAGTYAFYPNKSVAAGEGGVVLAQDEDVLRRCRQLRNQGFDPRSGTWHASLPGISARLSEWHAAIARAQLARLDGSMARRRQVAESYAACLAAEARVEPSVPVALAERVAWFTYPIRLRADLASCRDTVMAGLRQAGIACNPYFTPVHHLPFHRGRHRSLPTPVSDDVGRRCLALPLHAGLGGIDVARICAALTQLLDRLGR